MGEKRLAHHRSGRVGRRWKSMCREHAYAERPTHSHQAFGMVDVDSFFLFSPILPCEDGKKRTKRSGFGRLCVSCFFFGKFLQHFMLLSFFSSSKRFFSASARERWKKEEKRGFNTIPLLYKPESTQYNFYIRHITFHTEHEPKPMFVRAQTTISCSSCCFVCFIQWKITRNYSRWHFRWALIVCWLIRKRALATHLPWKAL